MHIPAETATVLVGNDPTDLREQSMIPADSNVGTWFDPSPALADYDGSAGHRLPCKALRAKHLGLAVTAVPGAPDAFLVCHLYPCFL